MKLELLDTKEWTARDELANATSKPSHQVRPRSLTHTAGLRAMGTIMACITAQRSVLFACRAVPTRAFLRVSGLCSPCRLSDEPRDQRWRSDSLCASTERGTLRTRLSAATNARPTSAGWRGDSETSAGPVCNSAASARRGRRRPVGATQGRSVRLRFRARCATPTAFSSITTSRAMRSSPARVQPGAFTAQHSRLHPQRREPAFVQYETTVGRMR
jgi:hypothetical protein